MKKIISVLMAATLCLTAAPVNACAEELEPFVGDIIEEPFAYANSATSSLSINGGTATCTSTVDGKSYVTEIYINQTLYHYESGEWVTYAHWSDHQYGRDGSMTRFASSIPSGSYYLHSSFTLYTSDGFEQFSLDSSVRP